MKKPAGTRADSAHKRTDSYGVGYGRPPVHTQFKAGQSGNPKGKPKGRRKMGELLDAILNEQISIREGDAVRKISKGDALMRAIFLKAMKGDAKACATLIALCKPTGEFEREGSPIAVIERIIIDPKNRSGSS